MPESQRADTSAGGEHAPGSDRPGTRTGTREGTRREFLAGLGTSAATGRTLGAGLAAGTGAGLAGCVTLGSVVGGDEGAVEILAAGSLQRTLGEGLRDAVDVPITVEVHGSVTAARLVASGRRDPDIVALADTALFESILDVPWYATVATNELTLAHAGRPSARPVITADHWFDPILDGEISLGRTDPALDPLGYRTVFAAALGEEFYERGNLRQRLLENAGVYPETSLVSRLEAGVIDAAVVYRSMAVERGYPSVDLPAAIDLSDPTREYSTARYEFDDGTVVRGSPIRYGAWARGDHDRVRHVFRRLLDGDVLAAHGFGTPSTLPTFHGTVPAAFEG